MTSTINSAIDIDLQKKKSRIDGYGIFTNDQIQIGEIFYEVPIGNILFKPKAKCAYVGHDRFVDDAKVLNWINHSCDPNSELVIDIDLPFLRAIKNIQIGSEITVDYDKTEVGENMIPCNCQSQHCQSFFYVTK